MSTREQSPTEPVAPGRPPTVPRRRRRRLIAMLAATLATSVIWLIAHALGADFTLRASGQSVTVGLPAVIGFTLWFAGLGWAALALLERYTRRAATLWTLLASAVFLLSVIPIFAEHATAGTRAALVLIHTSVAVILIPLLRRDPVDTFSGEVRN
jgi:hypothetical protein